jgi:glucosyl-3-phosphoglycerate phosphatase
MTARQVIVLRHGLTDWNHSGRFQGQADVPLNEVGLAQAASAAEALLGLGITSIVSSDLSRAAVTAQIVATRLGLPVKLDPRLQEINVGEWAGSTHDEVFDREPEYRQRLAEGRDFRRSATGETAAQAGGRMAEALAEQAAGVGDDEVLLVVGHGMVSRVASLMLMGLDYSHFRLLSGLGNCHWISLVPGPDYWRLAGYNLAG